MCVLTLIFVLFLGLLICDDVLALFLFGALEVFTLILSWSTAILYLRHLVPHHFLVTGQALAVTAFFCIGKYNHRRKNSKQRLNS